MTELRKIDFAAVDLETLAIAEGRVAILVPKEGTMSPAVRRVNRLTKGSVARMLESEAWEKAKSGSVISLAYPTGMAAEAVDVVCVERRASVEEARKAGAALAKLAGKSTMTVMAENLQRPVELVLGVALRSYAFTARKSEAAPENGAVSVQVKNHEEVAEQAEQAIAVAEGVFFTRDLTAEPANVLTTTEFADRLVALKELGLSLIHI